MLFIAFVLLGIHTRGYRPFEYAIGGLFAVIAIGFLVDLSRVDGLAEREEPDEGRQRTVDLAHATACRDWVLTMEGCGGDRPEEVLHRLYRHPSGDEVTAQGRDASSGCPLRREGGASTGRCCGAIGHGRSAYGTGRPSPTGRATPPAGPRCRTR